MMLGQRRGGRFLMVPGFHLHPPGMHRCTCIAIPRPSGPAAFERQVPLSHHCRQPCVSKVQISMFGMLFVPTFPTCLAFFLHSASSSVKFVTSQKCVTMPCCLPCLALTWTQLQLCWRHTCLMALSWYILGAHFSISTHKKELQATSLHISRRTCQVVASRLLFSTLRTIAISCLVAWPLDARCCADFER